ncbi:MAG: YhgE/Pip family protein, partial [Propionibacteriaceae bacterium]|nr:YhgE/Pip family protein [Propionibacteriaceae bacterium]
MNRKFAGIGLLLLIPVLIAGGFIWAGWDSSSRLKNNVEAAIVNLDVPVTVNEQYIPLGRQMTAALIDSNREENLKWKLTSLNDGREGLTNGKYAAMVVIPKEFSELATSFSKDAKDAAKATIAIETSPISGIADAAVGKIVALAATTTLNETLTSSYLDQLYLGFNLMKDQYQELADGSKQLADGSQELSEGLLEGAAGANEAVDGMGQLVSGSRSLASGLATMSQQVRPLPEQTKLLSNGMTQLSDGLGVMADNVKPLPEQVKQLSNGMTQLSDGLGVMADNVKPLPEQTKLLSNGMTQLSDGLGVMADNVKPLPEQVKQLS